MQQNANGVTRQFWTAKEAALYFGISVTTLLDYCKGKRRVSPQPRAKLTTNPPPFRRTGRGVIRFPVDEFKAWCRQLDYPK